MVPAEVSEPVAPSEDATDEEKAQYEADLAAYEQYLAEMEIYESELEQYESDMAQYEADMAAYEEAMAKYSEDMAAYEEAMKVYETEMAEYEPLKAAYDEYLAAKAEYDKYMAYKESLPELEAKLKEAEEDLNKATETRDSAKAALEAVNADEEVAAAIAEAEAALEAVKADEEYMNALADAEKVLNEAKTAAETAETEYAEAEKAYNDVLAITDPEKRTEEDVITVDNDKFTPITSEGGVVIGYSFTLKAGETITLTDLPLDTAYDIREVDSKGAVEITANGSAVSENEMVSGKIDVENGTAVTFNNTFKTITVEKKYVDDIYSGEVTIDIFRVDGETETLYKTVTLKGNSSVTVTVGNGEYKAVEREIPDNEVTYSENVIIDDTNLSGTIIVTNDYDEPYVSPDTYSVTVEYVDADTGATIANTRRSGGYEYGEHYDVTSLTSIEIPGYTWAGIDGSDTGVIRGDVTIVVMYTKEEDITDPEPPLIDPEDPDGGEEDITDPEPPLVDPDIPDENIDNPDIPKTGGMTGAGFLMAGLAAVALGTSLKKKKGDK